MAENPVGGELVFAHCLFRGRNKSVVALMPLEIQPSRAQSVQVVESEVSYKLLGVVGDKAVPTYTVPDVKAENT